jgi:hypothetical protein
LGHVGSLVPKSNSANKHKVHDHHYSNTSTAISNEEASASSAENNEVEADAPEEPHGEAEVEFVTNQGL